METTRRRIGWCVSFKSKLQFTGRWWILLLPPVPTTHLPPPGYTGYILHPFTRSSPARSLHDYQLKAILTSCSVVLGSHRLKFICTYTLWPALMQWHHNLQHLPPYSPPDNGDNTLDLKASKHYWKLCFEMQTAPIDCNWARIIGFGDSTHMHVALRL